MAKVIPARRWRNSVTGASASIYGAAPYASEAAKADWAIETSGYVIQWDDGTVGNGRPPYATEAEAQTVLDRNPAFTGMNQG